MAFASVPVLNRTGATRPEWSSGVTRGDRRAALRRLMAVAILCAMAFFVATALLAAPEKQSVSAVRARAVPPAKTSIPGDPHC